MCHNVIIVLSNNLLLMLTYVLVINSHFISKFCYNLNDLSSSQCLKYSRHVHLTAEKISQVDCIQPLFLARSNHHVTTEGFSDRELN